MSFVSLKPHGLVLVLTLVACSPAPVPDEGSSQTTTQVSQAPSAGSTAALPAEEASAPTPMQVTPGQDAPQVAELDPSTIPGARATGPIRQRLMVWNDRGATQAEFAEIFRDVLRSPNRRDMSAMLTEFSRMMSAWRVEWSPELMAELQSFAAPGNDAIWAMVDGRYVPAAVEALLDVEDDAAVMRLATAYADSPGARALEGPRRLASQRMANPAMLEFIEPPKCPVLLDEELLGEGMVHAVMRGTHTLRCANSNDPPIRITLPPGGTTRLAGDLLPP
jgi:hypothetical protein